MNEPASDEAPGIELILDTEGLPDEFEGALFRRLLGNVKISAHEHAISESMIVRVRVEKK